MTVETYEIKMKAVEAKTGYLCGALTKKEAKLIIDEYINLYNKTAKEKAEKFGIKPIFTSFQKLIRSNYF
ncbi:MAG: hypothetical protein ACRC57_00450 [Sarcina sp.]